MGWTSSRGRCTWWTHALPKHTANGAQFHEKQFDYPFGSHIVTVWPPFVNYVMMGLHTKTYTLTWVWWFRYASEGTTIKSPKPDDLLETGVDKLGTHMARGQLESLCLKNLTWDLWCIITYLNKSSCTFNLEYIFNTTLNNMTFPAFFPSRTKPTHHSRTNLAIASLKMYRKLQWREAPERTTHSGEGKLNRHQSFRCRYKLANCFVCACFFFFSFDPTHSWRVLKQFLFYFQRNTLVSAKIR